MFAYDSTSSYLGSPPVTTPRDALVSGFGARDTSFGPTVTIQDPISGREVPAYLDTYVFGFDEETYQYVVDNFDSLDNILDLPLLPSNPVQREYIAKAPPRVDPGEGIDQTKPVVYWAQLMPYRQERIPECKSLEVSVNPPTFYDPPILVFSHYRCNPVSDPAVRACRPGLGLPHTACHNYWYNLNGQVTFSQSVLILGSGCGWQRAGRDQLERGRRWVSQCS